MTCVFCVVTFTVHFVYSRRQNVPSGEYNEENNQAFFDVGK